MNLLFDLLEFIFFHHITKINLINFDLKVVNHYVEDYQHNSFVFTLIFMF